MLEATLRLTLTSLLLRRRQLLQGLRPAPHHAAKGQAVDHAEGDGGLAHGTRGAAGLPACINPSRCMRGHACVCVLGGGGVIGEEEAEGMVKGRKQVWLFFRLCWWGGECIEVRRACAVIFGHAYYFSYF
jgi:hypothetical protein